MQLFLTINDLKSKNKIIMEENLLLKKRKTLSVRLNKLEQKYIGVLY